MDKKVKVSSILISILILATLSFLLLLSWKHESEKNLRQSYDLADSLNEEGKYE